MPKFTPTVFLEAPGRSAPQANEAGTHALFIKSSYSFDTHSKTVQLHLLDLNSGETTLIVEDDTVAESFWLDEAHDIAWLSGRKTGNTSIIVANVKEPTKHYTAGVIPGSAAEVKTKSLRQGLTAFAFCGKANPDGSLFNAEDCPKPLSSGKYYTSNMTRHWDTWTAPQRNAIFYGMLEINKSGKFVLSSLQNVLGNRTDGLESPVPPFGGKNCYDLGASGIVFAAKDPTLDPSLYVKMDCYYVPIEDFKSSPGKAVKILTDGLEGAATSPVFSAGGKTVAFLKMKRKEYEADKNRVMIVKDITSNASPVELLKSDDGRGSWDLTPSSVSFTKGNHLLLLADERARNAVFIVSLESGPNETPRKLTQSGYISSAKALPHDQVLVSGSSFVDSSYYQILGIATSGPAKVRELSSEWENSGKLGLSQAQVSDMSWKGHHGRDIHGLVMKPSDFDPSKKYPVCFLIHGGPQSAWYDRWNNYIGNPQIFAEQGYVVIVPNVTGSTGYGQDFIDAINKNWGGSPYEDIAKCFEHVKGQLDYADTDKAVLGGLSFGGYMTNWIQGQPLGREFKALFTLNGIFSTHSMLATEELYFPKTDMGGFPWESEAMRTNWDRWDPARFCQHWSTPHFILHTEKDFRLSIDNGLAAFNVLQARGVESVFLRFEDENHVVQQPENLLVLYNALFNFLNQHVGLPPLAEEVEPVRGASIPS